MDSIIFDVDGTLWDSTESVAQSWTAYLQEKEHMDITLTSARLMTLFGQTLSDIARQIFPDCSEAEQLRLIDGCCQAEHEALLKKCAPLYEDLEKMLQIMYKKCPLYIVSNSQSGYIEVFLQTSGLEKYFKGHLCNGDTGLDKGSNIRKLADTYDLKSPVYVNKLCSKTCCLRIYKCHDTKQNQCHSGSLSHFFLIILFFAKFCVSTLQKNITMSCQKHDSNDQCYSRKDKIK